MTRLLAVILFTIVAYGCGGGEPSYLTQATPISANQAFMISEMGRFQTILNMGEFIAIFEKPPHATYAGWATPNFTGHGPWYVHFNKEFVEGLDISTKRSYMSALTAHEMCHHWVTLKNGRTYDEPAAENCAYSLVTFGRPE